MSFKRLDPTDLVVSAESITAPVWSEFQPILTTFFTSSVQEASTPGAFFLDVYQTGSQLDNAEVQFSIAYCDKKGSGSLSFEGNVSGSSPSRVNYGTYRTLILGDEESDVQFGEVPVESFFAINIDRSRYREKLLPGSLELTLQSGSYELVLTEIISSTQPAQYLDCGRVYQLKAYSSDLTQTITEGSDLFRDSGSYGLHLPDIGVILLNSNTLSAFADQGGLNLPVLRNSNTDDKNSRNLFNVIVPGSSFKLNYQETISSNYAFIRVRNNEFNYSGNPSYLTGSGELRFDSFIDDPKAYFTTIGLYNDNADLLAVAKLSRPLLKDSRKEALVRLKLDF